MRPTLISTYKLQTQTHRPKTSFIMAAILSVRSKAELQWPIPKSPTCQLLLLLSEFPIGDICTGIYKRQIDYDS